MERGSGLDAVNLGNFGPVVARHLVAGARADLDYGTGGGGDQSRDSFLDFPFSELRGCERSASVAGGRSGGTSISKVLGLQFLTHHQPESTKSMIGEFGKIQEILGSTLFEENIKHCKDSTCKVLVKCFIGQVVSI